MNSKGGERHAPRDARFIPVILPGEDDMIVRDVDKPVIGDRHSMRISRIARRLPAHPSFRFPCQRQPQGKTHPYPPAAEITQNLFGPGKGSLAVNHPVEPVKRRKVGGEGVGVGEIDKIGEKVQAPRAISSEKLQCRCDGCHSTVGHRQQRMTSGNLLQRIAHRPCLCPVVQITWPMTQADAALIQKNEAAPQCNLPVAGQPGAHFFDLRCLLTAENGLDTRTSIACCRCKGPICFSVQSRKSS